MASAAFAGDKLSLETPAASGSQVRPAARWRVAAEVFHARCPAFGVTDYLITDSEILEVAVAGGSRDGSEKVS